MVTSGRGQVEACSGRRRRRRRQPLLKEISRDGLSRRPWDHTSVTLLVDGGQVRLVVLVVAIVAVVIGLHGPSDSLEHRALQQG